MSWYVKREKVEQVIPSLHPLTAEQRKIVGWVGPIRSAVQARRESNAWIYAGWTAGVYESSPAIKAEVRAWQKAADAARAER